MELQKFRFSMVGGGTLQIEKRFNAAVAKETAEVNDFN